MLIKCSKCQKEKSPEEFSKDKKNKKRFERKYYCRVCDRRIENDRYFENSEKRIKQVKKYQAALSPEEKEKIKQYKKEWRQNHGTSTKISLLDKNNPQ